MQSNALQASSLSQPPRKKVKRELGDGVEDDIKSTASKTSNGRPVRAGAGKRLSLPSGFVNPDDAMIDAMIDAQEESTSDGEEKDTNTRTKGKKRKIRGNFKSPPPPSLSPVPSDISARTSASPPPDPSPSEVSFTVNVPQGQTGPLTIKLDLAPFVDQILASRAGISSQVSSEHSHYNLRGRNPPSTGVSSPYCGKGAVHTQRVSSNKCTGFLDLPYELRLIVYKLAFIKSIPIQLLQADTFPRSGAFLSTCKTVNQEGSIVLYGENKFRFQRQFKTRATYKTGYWREVGFKDIRRFLTDIGPLNVALLRTVDFQLEDGIPSGYPGLQHPDNLRYVYDENLIDCLRILERYGLIRKFTVAFSGKKTVTRRDERFLFHLKKIKADEIKFVSSYDLNGLYTHATAYWRDRQKKIDPAAVEYLKKRMLRNTKLSSLQSRLEREASPENGDEIRFRNLVIAQRTRWLE